MSEVTMITGQVLNRTKVFSDAHPGPADGFTLSVLLDVWGLAGFPHPVSEPNPAEWTADYRLLIGDVTRIVSSMTGCATGSTPWHEAMGDVVETVRLDHIHR